MNRRHWIWMWLSMLAIKPQRGNTAFTWLPLFGCSLGPQPACYEKAGPGLGGKSETFTLGKKYKGCQNLSDRDKWHCNTMFFKTPCEKPHEQNIKILSKAKIHPALCTSATLLTCLTLIPAIRSCLYKMLTFCSSWIFALVPIFFNVISQ